MNVLTKAEIQVCECVFEQLLMIEFALKTRIIKAVEGAGRNQTFHFLTLSHGSFLHWLFLGLSLLKFVSICD